MPSLSTGVILLDCLRLQTCFSSQKLLYILWRPRRPQYKSPATFNQCSHLVINECCWYSNLIQSNLIETTLVIYPTTSVASSFEFQRTQAQAFCSLISSQSLRLTPSKKSSSAVQVRDSRVKNHQMGEHSHIQLLAIHAIICRIFYI